MIYDPKDVAASFSKAISFPDVVLQLDDMLNDGISNTADFAQVISRDPGLTATLLRFANSPVYGFPGRVASVDRAVSLIGMREIRDLVLAVAVRSSFDGISTRLISMSDFWRHSLCCALACRRIAEVVRHSQREVLFTAGLLHDIGQLAMFNEIPDVCQEVLLKAQYRSDEVEMFELEREIVGFDHQEVGVAIAEAWRFPGVLRDTIRFHHLPDEATAHRFESCVVHIGNSMAVLVELDMDGFSQVPPLSPSALTTVGLDEDQVLAMLPDVAAMFRDMRPVFGIAA